MSTNERFDESIARWLEQTAPARLPDRVLEATFVRTRGSRQRLGWRATLRHMRVARPKAVLIGAAVVVVVAAALTIGSLDRRPAVGPPVASADPRSPAPQASDTMWPQSGIDGVRRAQALADAGDPAYTWQVDPALVSDYWTYFTGGGQVELVDRFLREVLGWEAYVFNASHEGDFNPSVGAIDGAADGLLTDQRFLRCAPGRTNPLYPPGSDPLQGGSCAPTLDDLHYESVSLDLAQPDRRGPGGIWVVNRWRATVPFAQADPAVAEAQATRRLEAFLAARIAGQGAEAYVQVYDDVALRVPLLYATSSGAPYERYEIERVDEPSWPYADMTFSVRLFADRGATVVEQRIDWCCNGSGELWTVASRTTENGQPVIVSYAYSDGEVTVSAPGPWFFSGYGLYRDDEFRIEFTDPIDFESECAERDLPGVVAAPPADAAALAQAVVADPNFETTAPVAARVGGVDAVLIDVALAPGGTVCVLNYGPVASWIHALEPGLRLRLYLVDLPQGMSMRTLAITVIAPEARFQEVIEEAKPIIDSIEFHPG